MYYIRVKLYKESIITFVSLLRSIEDNIIFDRTERPKENIFELFVVNQGIHITEKILNLFMKQKIIINWNYYPIENSSLYQYA